MKKANIYLFQVISILFFYTISSCNHDYSFEQKKELMLIDSLVYKLAAIEKIMDIDLPEINERIDEMKQDIGKMKFTEKTLDGPMGQMMDKYVTIHKYYMHFYEPYKKAKTELSDLKIQMATLKESVLKKEYSKAKFKTFYNEERKSIIELEEFVTLNIQPVLAVEYDYRRIQKNIDQFLYGDSLKLETKP